MVALLLMVAAAGHAEDTGSAGTAEAGKDWSIELTPYAWLANVNGSVGVGQQIDPVGIGIVDLLEDLNGMVMVDLTAQYRRIGIIADAAWVEVSTTQNLNDPFFAQAGLNLGETFGTGAVSFRFRPWRGVTLDPYVGARWWRIHPTLSLTDGLLPDVQGSAVETWADPVFGARIRYAINDKWYARAVADVGGGVSTVSWQFLVGGGYLFTDWFALDVSHRSVGVDYSKQFTYDVITHGLQIGFNFRI